MHCVKCGSKNFWAYIESDNNQCTCDNCGHKWIKSEWVNDRPLASGIPEEYLATPKSDISKEPVSKFQILPVEDEDAYKDSNVAVDDVVINYTQNGDTETPNDVQGLKVWTVNNGMARYIVFSTERWAINNVDELIAVLEDFKRRAGLNKE